MRAVRERNNRQVGVCVKQVLRRDVEAQVDYGDWWLTGLIGLTWPSSSLGVLCLPF